MSKQSEPDISLLPSGEGGAQRRMRDAARIETQNLLRVRPSPAASRRPLPEGEASKSKLALHPEALAFARSLRGAQTDAENLMWFFLRDRRFMDLKFRRQHALPPYVLDFYCEPLKLAVELDGGQHNEESARSKDEKRRAYLRERGVEVVRYWNPDVLKNTLGVLEDLLLRCQLRASPSSAPAGHLLPVGEGQEKPLSPREGGTGEGLPVKSMSRSSP